MAKLSPHRKLDGRSLALTVAGVAFAFAAASAIVPGLQACRQKLAQTGDAGVVTVCEPAVGEAVLVGLLLLLVVLILLPLLAKFDIAGLISIELKADAAKEEAMGARRLAEQVQQQAAELTQVQAELKDIQERMLAETLVQPSAPEFERRLKETLAEYEAALGRSDTETETEERRRGALAENLLAMWSRLEHWGLGVSRTPALVMVVGGGVLDPKEFREQFKLEIEQVRAVRNRVAHGIRTETRELERAVDLASTLVKEAEARLGARPGEQSSRSQAARSISAEKPGLWPDKHDTIW